MGYLFLNLPPIKKNINYCSLEVVSCVYSATIKERFPNLSYKELDIIVLNCRRLVSTYLPDCMYLPLYYFARFSPEYSIKEPLVFMISLILITIKFAEDEFPSNKGIARLFYVDEKVMNDYEIEILKYLDYRLYLTGETYDDFLENNIKNIAEC